MRISQFQKYSQKENTVTNSLLLMLSRVNDIRPLYYEMLLNMINETDLSIRPIFKQQIGSKNGIVDGYIETKSSKIIIETKINGLEWVEKLIKYGMEFSNGCKNILWHVSRDKYNDNQIEDIRKRLKEKYKGIEIDFYAITFQDFVENLEKLYEDESHQELDLKLLISDFRDYCLEENLLPENIKYKLIFVPTSRSYDWNCKHKIYFCPSEWHKQKFSYFGLYENKSIRTLATVEKRIIADFDFAKKELIIDSQTKDITEKQKEKLRNALIEWGEDQEGLVYYLFDESNYIDIDFRKVSKGGIQGFRYKNLEEYFEGKTPLSSSVKDVANLLKEKTWN